MNQITPTGGTFMLVHYIFQTKPERVACMPNMTEFGRTRHHPEVVGSNDPRAVSCPACKKTEQYKLVDNRYKQ